MITQKLAQGIPETLDLVELVFQDCLVVDVFDEYNQGYWTALDDLLSNLEPSKQPSFEVRCIPPIPDMNFDIDTEGSQESEETKMGEIEKRYRGDKKELISLDQEGVFRRSVPGLYDRGHLWVANGFNSSAFLVASIEPERWQSRATNSLDVF